MHSARGVVSALLLAAVSGCSSGEPPPSTGSPSPSSQAPGAVATWSRDGAGPRAAASSSSEPPVAASVDPAALAELIAAAPKPANSAPEARAAIGSDTGVPLPSSSASAPLPPEPPARKVTVGKISEEPSLSSAAIERAARAQLYWPLVQRCRDREGKILPPDAVRLEFNVDADGYIVTSTIIAKARDERFTDAARCMRRELSTATFRAPASGRGRPHTIHSEVPSVD